MSELKTEQVKGEYTGAEEGSQTGNSERDSDSILNDILQKMNLIPAIQEDIRKIKEDTNSLKTTVKEIEISLEFTQTDVEDVQNTLEYQEYRLQTLEDKILDIEALKFNQEKLQWQIAELQIHARRENLILDGVPEKEEKKCMEVTIAYLKERQNNYELRPGL